MFSGVRVVASLRVGLLRRLLVFGIGCRGWTAEGVIEVMASSRSTG
jgi:hypothetical protein